MMVQAYLLVVRDVSYPYVAARSERQRNLKMPPSAESG